jgi:glycerol-3-phosphate O-acyltransferase
MLEINKSAAINGMALTSLCLLASKTYKMSENEFRQAIADYLDLFRAVPFSTTATIPDVDADTLLQSTLSLKRFAVDKDDFGKMIAPLPDKVAALTYYRNNIIHLFALPSLIMALVFSGAATSKSAIINTVKIVYPLLQKELFIYLSLANALAMTERFIEQFIAQGLLLEGKQLTAPSASSPAFHSAWLLSRVMQDTFQRYAIVLHVLSIHKQISRSALEKDARKIAERLSELFGVSSPEFSDKNVFATLINGLRENELVTTNEQGSLMLNEASENLQELVDKLVWPEVVQHLDKLD